MTIKLNSSGVVALLAILIAAPAASKESDVLPQEIVEREGALKLRPSSDWNLEVADDRCRLSRLFGQGESRHLLLIEQIAPGPEFDITLAGPEVTGFSTQLWLYRGLRSDQKMHSFERMEGEMRDFGGSMLMPSVSLAADREDIGAQSALIEPSDAALVERVVIRQANRIVSFETGNLKAAAQALNDCALDLLPYWSVDPASHLSYQRASVPGWRAYLAKMRHEFANDQGAKGHKALMRIRATIDSQGSVVDCHQELAASTGAEAPDVCTDIRSMEFEPALDEAGKPMSSFIAQSVALWPYSPFTTGADGARYGD